MLDALHYSYLSIELFYVSYILYGIIFFIYFSIHDMIFIPVYSDLPEHLYDMCNESKAMQSSFITKDCSAALYQATVYHSMKTLLMYGSIEYHMYFS